MSLMLRMATLEKSTPSGVTYATWNPSDKNAFISLSGGDLTANIPALTVGSVRATLGKSSGKWYWELTGVGGSGPIVGIAPSTLSVSSDWAGNGAGSWGYYGSGGIYNGGGVVGSGIAYTTTDVLGFALDMTGLTLEFYKNNSLAYTASIASGTWYPTASQSGGTNYADVVANFGASSLVYSPPAGYNAGLY